MFRSVFGGTAPDGEFLQREREIEVLNLSFSQTSSRSIRNFCKAINLRVLILDHCEKLRRSRTKGSICYVAIVTKLDFQF